MEEKKQKTWLRYRHRVIRHILYVILGPYCLLKYGLKPVPFKEQGKRPYLILLNHVTPFDQFFVGMVFKRPVYYVATEDIFSLGWISGLIRWLIAPIPIRKQTTDINAVMTCIRVAREGGTICLAPEGNRSYSGRTEYMNPAIAGLAKKLKLPIALFRIEGGYGSQPRWSDGVRRGTVRGYVAEVIEPEELAALSKDALLQRIRQGLMVNDCAAGGNFKSKKSAEYLERAYYVCPKCGLSGFHSEGNTFRCTQCGMGGTYDPDLQIRGDFPFANTLEWYDYQASYINSLDVTTMTETPLYQDTANVSRVIVYKRKEPLHKDARIRLYGDRIVINDDMVFPFADTHAVTVLGRNKLNIYFAGEVFQLKSDKRFCALKYVHMFHRFKNIQRGESNDQFLGL